MKLLVGTYTLKSDLVDGQGKGLYYFDLDEEFNKAPTEKLIPIIENPTYLIPTPSAGWILSVHEEEEGRISCTKINKDMELQSLSYHQSHGNSPCHLVYDPEMKTVYVANYMTGSISATLFDDQSGEFIETLWTIRPEEHSGVDPDRQEGPHAHFVSLLQNRELLITVDLGNDECYVYRVRDGNTHVNPPTKVGSLKLPPGAGPRHIGFHPNGKWLYVVNELNNSVSQFEYSYENNTFSGNLLENVSTIPEAFRGKNYPAAIRISPNGNILYVSNRGHESIAIFKIDPKNGHLDIQGHESVRGVIPRDFNCTDNFSHLVVANQNSHNVVVFDIDQDTGLLSFATQFHCPSPVCVVFV